jgi:hypothetical protein
MGPAREPGTGTPERTGNGTREATGKLAAYGWTKKALTANGITEAYGKRELRLEGSEQFRSDN